MWTSHPLCKDVVKQAWEYRSTRSRAYQLRSKLSNVRKTFLIWNKEFFGRVEQDINHKKEQLKRLQNSIYNLDVKKENELREDLETLMNREEVTWSQKSRCNWIILGDRYTKYFQTVVKQRRARNRILQLKTEDGVSMED